MSDSLNRITVVVIAAIIVVLLFFAPKKPSSVPAPETAPVANLETEVKLPPDQQNMYETLKLALDKAGSEADKKKALESLVQFFEQNKQPLQVAVYYKKLAELEGTAQAWYESGERFYRAVVFVDENQVPAVYENAIGSYGKALELDKDNENAKIKMGVCYVEMGSDPMKGVGLLREVAEKDPKNIEAQLNLGFFSIRSKQYDKAIARFNNVLKIDTGYVDALVYLAQTYEMMADTDNAVNYYTQYRDRVKDTVVSNQVNEYIQKFKRSKRPNQ